MGDGPSLSIIHTVSVGTMLNANIGPNIGLNFVMCEQNVKDCTGRTALLLCFEERRPIRRRAKFRYM